MSKTFSRERAAAVRVDYQKKRVQTQATQLTVLPDPGVPGVIDPSDGTLNKDVLGADLEVVIAGWPNLPEPGYDEYDTLQLELANVDGAGAVGPFRPVGTTHQYDATSDFPATITVPKDELVRDGTLQLRYSILFHNFNSDISNPIPLICDSTPPWGEVEPQPVSLPSGPVTDAYFVANPNGIPLTLPEYPGRAASDSYALYYSATVPVAPYPDPVATGKVPNDRTVLIPKAEVEARGDGHFYIVYLLLDKATNRSRISEVAEVFVNLGALPSGLKEPVVPLAADGLIDLEDAQASVNVEIPAFANHRQTDDVEVTWGTAPPFTEQIGSRPFPLVIGVPSEHLRQAYGAADDEVVTTVSYRVLRHGVPYGPESVDVKVDFSVVGPSRPDPDPTWPDPINAALVAPIVKGKTSDIDNELKRVDAGQAADLLFTLYTPAKDGEVVNFYWAGTLVKEATYIVDTTDTSPIKVEIPWSYILAAGNQAQLPVHYTIRKAEDAGNEQRSVTALVAADAVTEVPEAAQFERMQGRWLNCSSLWEDPSNPTGDPAFRVAVKPLTKYLPQGGKVTMVWTALAKRDGDTEIPAAKKTEEITITQAQAENGFTWDIKPYQTHILPIYNYNNLGPDGRGRVHYALEYKGETIRSEDVEAWVGLGVGGSTCPVP